MCPHTFELEHLLEQLASHEKSKNSIGWHKKDLQQKMYNFAQMFEKFIEQMMRDAVSSSIWNTRTKTWSGDQMKLTNEYESQNEDGRGNSSA